MAWARAEKDSKEQLQDEIFKCAAGRPLQNICTTQDAKKLCLHLKFLTCDYLTNERISIDKPNLSAACDLCQHHTDSIEHVLTSCRATAEVRRRLYPELVNTVNKVQPMSNILLQHPPDNILAHFILDCTSFNLPESLFFFYKNKVYKNVYT